MRLSSMGEVVSAFIYGEEVADFADLFPEGVECSGFCGSEIDQPPLGGPGLMLVLDGRQGYSRCGPRS